MVKPQTIFPAQTAAPCAESSWRKPQLLGSGRIQRGCLLEMQQVLFSSMGTFCSCVWSSFWTKPEVFKGVLEVEMQFCFLVWACHSQCWVLVVSTELSLIQLLPGKNQHLDPFCSQFGPVLPAALAGGVVWPLQQTPSVLPVQGIPVKKQPLECGFTLGICCLH